ncbi:hypothetical protein GW860_07855 [bacterium]|nr:hypothetical protein [bacterium]
MTSHTGFTRANGLSVTRISHVVNGKRTAAAEMALLFGKAFNHTPRYRITLQAAYDLVSIRK